MRARKASVSWVEVSAPRAIKAPASAMLSKVRSLMALLVGAEDMRWLGGPGPMAGNTFHHLQQCDIALVQMLDVLGRQRQAGEGRPCAEFVECRWLFRRIHPILPFASMQSTCRVSPWLGPCMNRVQR